MTTDNGVDGYETTPFIVFFVVLALCGIGIFSISRITESKSPQSTTRCRVLPTETVAWGIHVQAAHGELYLCFQQGADRGTTEITCTPMEDCRR